MTYTDMKKSKSQCCLAIPYVPYRTVMNVLAVIVPNIIDTHKSEKGIHVDKDKDIDRDGDREAQT